MLGTAVLEELLLEQLPVPIELLLLLPSALMSCIANFLALRRLYSAAPSRGFAGFFLTFLFKLEPAAALLTRQ